jgi:hypothetical protein
LAVGEEVGMRKWLKRQWRAFTHISRVETNSAMYDSHKEEWSFLGMLEVAAIIGAVGFVIFVLYHWV